MQLAGRFDDAAFIDDALEHLKIDEVHGAGRLFEFRE
jgi:hypothetical protein